MCVLDGFSMMSEGKVYIFTSLHLRFHGFEWRVWFYVTRSVMYLCLEFWEMEHNFKKCALAIKKDSNECSCIPLVVSCVRASLSAIGQTGVGDSWLCDCNTSATGLHFGQLWGADAVR